MSTKYIMQSYNTNPSEFNEIYSDIKKLFEYNFMYQEGKIAEEFVDTVYNHIAEKHGLDCVEINANLNRKASYDAELRLEKRLKEMYETSLARLDTHLDVYRSNEE